MASEPKTIEVEPGGELDRLLDEATDAPLRLVRGEERFRVVREPESRTDPTATGSAVDDRRPSAEQVARSIEGIREAAGAWAGIVDAEAFKAYVRQRRRTANRPPVRW